MTNRIPTGALLAGALVLLTPLASAQAPDIAPEDLKQHGMSVADIGHLLDSRDRELLHPGQPLIVVGNEEGDNEFRHSTPLLEGAFAARGTLDPAEARDRRLAMYTAGAHFSAPLRRSSAGATGFDSCAPSPGSDVAGDSARSVAEQPSAAATGCSFLPWLLGCLSLVVLAYRKRHVFTHLS